MVKLKKLTLNKEVISNLSTPQMNHIRGGTENNGGVCNTMFWTNIPCGCDGTRDVDASNCVYLHLCY